MKININYILAVAPSALILYKKKLKQKFCE